MASRGRAEHTRSRLGGQENRAPRPSPLPLAGGPASALGCVQEFRGPQPGSQPSFLPPPVGACAGAGEAAETKLGWDSRDLAARDQQEALPLHVEGTAGTSTNAGLGRQGLVPELVPPPEEPVFLLPPLPLTHYSGHAGTRVTSSLLSHTHPLRDLTHLLCPGRIPYKDPHSWLLALPGPELWGCTGTQKSLLPRIIILQANQRKEKLSESHNLGSVVVKVDFLEQENLR